MKKALIFGVSGQAGSYLVDLLLKKDYTIYGTYNTHPPYMPKLTYPKERYFTLKCDICYPEQVSNAIKSCVPDEIYNMAAMMYAPASWKIPSNYMIANAVSVSDMLSTYSVLNPQGRFFQAGSAEVFDKIYPQDETTLKRPRNPYGVSKVAAHGLTRVYREEKQFFSCTGIFFNMESPRRDKFFFTRKVTLGIRDIVNKKSDKLELGNLSAVRDWGLTEEYVEAAWMMLQTKTPEDYVIGTGEAHSCWEFVEQACKVAGIATALISYDKTEPAFIDKIQSDPSKIKKELGWEAKSKFLGVVKYLMDAELKGFV